MASAGWVGCRHTAARRGPGRAATSREAAATPSDWEPCTPPRRWTRPSDVGGGRRATCSVPNGSGPELGRALRCARGGRDRSPMAARDLPGRGRPAGSWSCTRATSSGASSTSGSCRHPAAVRHPAVIRRAPCGLGTGPVRTVGASRPLRAGRGGRGLAEGMVAAAVAAGESQLRVVGGNSRCGSGGLARRFGRVWRCGLVGGWRRWGVWWLRVGLVGWVRWWRAGWWSGMGCGIWCCCRVGGLAAPGAGGSSRFGRGWGRGCGWLRVMWVIGRRWRGCWMRCRVWWGWCTRQRCWTTP